MCNVFKIVVCPFVVFRLVIVLSVLLRFTDLYYPFSIFKFVVFMGVLFVFVLFFVLLIPPFA